MEIHHLRYFVAVAEELSFTRAAERLRMAASPLSRRIKDLEREMDTTLFVRGYHNVMLTEAGTRLLPAAIDVLRRFDALPGFVPEDGSIGNRAAVVGIGPEVSPALRETFHQAVGERLSGLAIRLVPASTAPLLRAVLRGDADVVFVHGRVTDPELRSVRVESQPVGIVVARGIGFDDHGAIELPELTHLPYISLKERAAPYIYRMTDEMLLRSGVQGRMTVQTNNPGDMVPIVVAGQAFTICGLDYGATHKAFVDEPVRVLPIMNNPVRIATYAVWRADDGPNRAIVRTLVGLVKDSLTVFVREGSHATDPVID